MYRKPVLLFSLLFLLICTGCSSLHQAAGTGDFGAATDRIRAGKNVNATDPFGRTPLMIASAAGHIDVMQRLLDNGAAIRARDQAGKTALDYALDARQYEAFHLLLVNGAELPEETLRRENVAADDREYPFYRLARETALYRQMQKDNPSAELFDQYFFFFSDGENAPAVERMFQQKIRSDYEQTGSPPEAASLRQFVRQYDNLGKNRYRVTVNGLNIREKGTVSAARLGSYAEGDMVYAFSVRNGWIKTDRGWISKRYTEPAPQIPTALSPWLEKARKQLAALARPARPAPQPRRQKADAASPQKTAPAALPEQKSEPADSPPATTAAVPMPSAKQELTAILASPTLPELETFILKYKDKPGYATLVQTARTRYKAILLGE